MEDIYALISRGPKACVDENHPQFYEVFGHGKQTWLLIMDIDSAKSAFGLPTGDDLFAKMLELVMPVLGLRWEVPCIRGLTTVDVLQAVWFTRTPSGVVSSRVWPLAVESVGLWGPEIVRATAELGRLAKCGELDLSSARAFLWPVTSEES